LLTRQTRDAVVNGEVQMVGHLPAAQILHFDIVLALRHAPELQNFLQDVYDPSSSSYRHFVTVKEFTERFGPSQEDYDALIQFAKVNGFKITGGSRDAMDVRFTAPVGTIEKAFHVTMNLYQHPTENRTFYSPDREPTVDLPFQLWHISGLDNYTLPRTTLLRNKGQAKSGVTGSGPGGNFLGSDMRAAYYGNGPLTGAGQTIGLLEYAGTDLADLNTYYKNVGQTLNTPITLVSVDGTSVNCTSPNCDDTEQTIDMTQALGMAPNTSSLVMFIGSSDTALLSGMSSYNPLPAQLSASWIWQTSPAADDPYFQKMAAQGQNYFNAAGDDAEFNSGYPTWPADAAYVTSVGGTDLVTQSAGGPWASETAWSDSGGGYWPPDDIPFPSWQAGVVNSQNEASSTYRNAPDVAANANFTFYYCADQSGCGTGLGGTSFAAPMWAAYLALANEQGASNGNPPLGFINPALYQIGLGPNYSVYFHDVTSGSNGFPAVVGYDLVTGWGSPNGANLINALGGPAGPSFTLTASPGSLTIVEGGTGATTVTVTDFGGFSGAVTLSAANLPSGVTAVFGTNPTSTTSSLTFTVSPTAAVGTSTVQINGVSGSITYQGGVQLTVSPAPLASFSPASLAFGNESAGQTSKTKSITVTNTGKANLKFTSVTPSGDFAVQTNTCTNQIVPGGKCLVTVSFTPTQLGARTGSITFSDNAPNSPQSVPVTGTGTADATLTPATAKFPKTKSGTTSAAKTFTFTNKESAALTGVSVSTTGNFNITSNTCGSTLGAKSKCTIQVVFAPAGTGVQTGSLEVNSNAFGSPQTSTLSGTGK
ncbi:MAG: choice-of-anchor D domain-containing protein, partial [Terriglobales bacterium]